MVALCAPALGMGGYSNGLNGSGFGVSPEEGG